MKLSKKVIALVIMISLLTACSGSQNKTNNQKQASVEVKNKVINKEITISKDFLDLAEVSDPQKGIDTLVEEGKIKSGKINDDGSVTYTMSTKQHKEYMKALKESIYESNQDLINDTETSITDIKCNNDFSKFDVYVDPSTYSEFESFLSLGFYLEAGFYKMFNGDKSTDVIVNYINKDTDEIIYTFDSRNIPKSDTSIKDIDVKVEELPYKIEEQAPDSIGEVYGKATFTNNSKYPIKYYELSGVMPSTNESTYFMSADTVMPGETSPNFESFYEEGTSIDKISYTYIKDGQEITVDYDVKLKSYSKWNY